MSTSSQETQRALNSHLRAFAAGDVDAIMRDFSEDAVVYTPDGALRGKEPIRELFEALIRSLPPGSRVVIAKEIVDGELAYLIWSAESDRLRMPFATDTMIVRDGKIVRQSFAAQILKNGPTSSG